MRREIVTPCGRAAVGLFAVTLIAALPSDAASAQSEAAALVEKRQDDMKQMGRAFRVFVPIIKGESENLRDAAEAASHVSTVAAQIPANFPVGTGREAAPETRAKPEVWLERAAFEAAAARLVEESNKLAEIAMTNDIAAFREQFKSFVSACGGCHLGPSEAGGKFRLEKE